MEPSAENNAASEEELFEPMYYHENYTTHYSYGLEGAGLFHCSKTNLLFQTTKEADIYYRTKYWDDRLVQSTGKTPAGLLFKIECEEGVISQLHLAHALVNIGDLDLSVAQITDDGINILKPVKVTATHAVVDVPVDGQMMFGLVSNIPFFPKPIHGQIQLYLRPPRSLIILSLFALPANIPITELESQHTKDVQIKRPNTHCLFTRDRKYQLKCSPCRRSQPERAHFFLNYGPNYHATFEAHIEFTQKENPSFEVLAEDGTTIWKQDDVDISGYLPENVPRPNV